MHDRPSVRSVSLSLRCLLVLGLIVLAGAGIDAAPLFPDPIYSTGSRPVSVAVADFNGDQALDLATANGGDISILLAGEDGDFEPEHRVPMGGEPFSIAAADFNEDGKPDLVVTDSTGLAVVFLGSGDGSFVMNDAYPVGDNPRVVAVADLNLDGVPDLAVANLYSSDVSVLLGVGNGTFHAELRFPAGGGAFSLAVTDFNQDGFPDLAVATAYDSRGAVLLFGQGDGAFDPPVWLDTGPGGIAICAADFNLDGHPDLAVGSNHFTAIVTVLLGDGAGGIQARIPEVVADTDWLWLAAADFDGDGVPDLATRSGTLPGNADGSFGPLVPFGSLTIFELHGAAGIQVRIPNVTRADIGWSAAADFNGGGVPDPATRTATLPGYADGSSGPVPSGAFVGSGAIADLDADGHPDLAGAYDLAFGGVLILYNDGQGQLGVHAYTAGELASIVVEGDFDGNGFTDLVAPSGEEVSVLLGRGDGTFAPESRVPTGKQSMSGVAAGDFDGDGRLDLAFYQRFGGILSMLRGTGDGGFQPPVDTTIHITPSSLAVGDFNGDGRADLVCVRDRSEFLQVLLGKPDGTFEVIDQVGPQMPASAAAVGDFNADGKQDLAVAYPGAESVSILPGKGDGTFGLGEFYGAGDHLFALAAIDLNSDGKLDVAAGHAFTAILGGPWPGCCPALDKVSILLGRGDGTLGEETRYDSGESLSLGVADFDLDGHLDLISSSSTILFGAGDGAFGRARQFAYFGPGVVDDFNRDSWPDVAVAHGWILVALNQGSSNHSPIAMAGVDTALECASPGGAEALLDGSASSDPDSTPGTRDDIVAFDWFEDYGLSTQQQLGSGETLHLVLPLGLHAITLRVTDRAGASATSETSIRIADTVPPQLSVHLSPNLLWPPNRQMVDISAEVTVADACGQAGVILSSIQSAGQASASRRDAYTGNNVSGAEMGTSDFSFQLRAERSTSKQGWFYLVTYSAIDAAGNQSSATGIVRVYHDRRRSSATGPSP